MPKQKTKKAVAERIKVTGTGKLMRHKPGAGHLMSRKSPKRLRNFRKEVPVNESWAKVVRKALGLPNSK